MRWVGIDEAGYGPNLGPLVMTAVVAEGPGPREPDVWTDLAATAARAGDPSDRLWVDDSKAVLRVPAGRARLEATCLALLAAAGGVAPREHGRPSGRSRCRHARGCRADPLARRRRRCSGTGGTAGPAGRAACSVRGGSLADLRRARGRGRPARFNAELAATGSKAKVHFAAFIRLLGPLWDRAGEGASAGDATYVRGDKHGGRHFYYGPLLDAFPDVWIDRGPEGPESEPLHPPRTRPTPGTEPPTPRRRHRWARGAGLDRQQDGSRALDGPLQCALDCPHPGSPSHGRLSPRLPALPPGYRAGLRSTRPRPEPLVAAQMSFGRWPAAGA